MPECRIVLLFAMVISMIVLPHHSPRAAAPEDPRLVQASAGGDIAAVRALLKAGVDVNGTAGDGATPLLMAVHRGDVGMTQVLLAAHAKVDAANNQGVTPLLEACRLANLPIIDALLKAGAAPDLASPRGESPLMAASASGALPAVRTLIALGADVNAREQAVQQTALMWASEAGHADVVRALLEAGADPNIADRPSSLSRELPVDAGGRTWLTWESGGFTALMFAARQGHLAAAAVLLEAGADVNAANPDRLTPLILAVLNDRLDLAALLLDKGANPNDGALVELIRLHNSSVVEANPYDDTRRRLTHDNVVSPMALIERMLARGADPMRVATYTLNGPGYGSTVLPVNQTPLGQALASQDVAVLKLLLANRANPNAAPLGVPPLVAAVNAGGGGGRGRGAAAPVQYRFTSERSVAATVQLLLDAGADVNAADATAGDTALHAAARIGNTAIIQLLADRGANLTPMNQAGLTPLDVAAGVQARGAGPGPAAFGGRGGGGGVQPAARALMQRLLGLPVDPAPVAGQ